MKRAICIVLTVTLFCGAFAYLCFAEPFEPDLVVNIGLPAAYVPDGKFENDCFYWVKVNSDRMSRIDQIDLRIVCNRSLFDVYKWEEENPMGVHPWDPDLIGYMRLSEDGFEACVYRNPNRYPDDYSDSDAQGELGTSVDYIEGRCSLAAGGSLDIKRAEGTIWYTDGTWETADVQIRATNAVVAAEPASQVDGEPLIADYPAREPAQPPRRIETTPYRGDADGDLEVTARDARLVLRASAKLERLYYNSFFRCDVDHDRKLTARDARKILRVSAKLESFA